MNRLHVPADLPRSKIDTFWSRVDLSGECWLWTAGKDTNGYGVYAGGPVIPESSRRGHQNIRAHVFAWELERGPVPDLLQIDHECHVRPCVRVDHLRAVTQPVNGQNRKGANQNTQSGELGVSWNSQSQRWLLMVHINGRRVYGGRHRTIELAVARRTELLATARAAESGAS
jgi:hypothetical protein